MNELISIIVPIYNVEIYLEKCLNSIINQTYKNIEILLINDGSSDNSLRICKKYQKKDKRIVLINKKNGGLSSARNAGIDKASGNYLLFIDSDDYIEIDMIEKLYNNIKSNNADISICNFFITKKNKDRKNKSCKNFTVRDEKKYNYLYNSYSLQTILSWNKLYKKCLFKNIRYPEGLLHEDQYVIDEILNRAKIINYMTSEFLYHYVQREKSIMNTFNIKRFDVIKGLEKRIIFFENINRNDLVIRTKVEKLQSLYFLLNYTKKYNFNKSDKEIIELYKKDYIKLSKDLKQVKMDLKSKIKLILILNFPKIYNLIKGIK